MKDEICHKCGEGYTKIVGKNIFDTHTIETESFYCFKCDLPKPSHSKDESALIEKMAEAVELEVGRMGKSLARLLQPQSTTSDYKSIAKAALAVVREWDKNAN